MNIMIFIDNEDRIKESWHSSQIGNHKDEFSGILV
jgi:hypothetical protein